jgi:hypothetical protein
MPAAEEGVDASAGEEGRVAGEAHAVDAADPVRPVQAQAAARAAVGAVVLQQIEGVAVPAKGELVADEEHAVCAGADGVVLAGVRADGGGDEREEGAETERAAGVRLEDAEFVCRPDADPPAAVGGHREDR